MKMSHYIILFIIIYFLPLLFVEIKYGYASHTMKENQKYEISMTAAVQDAIDTLHINAKPHLELGYDSYKISSVDPQPAFDSFIKTLALNFKAYDEISEDIIKRYIPVFAIVDYDGLLLNVYQEYTDSRNEVVLERVWLPKIPFSYTDKEGNIINFTIDEHLEVYDVQLDEWVEGTRREILDDSEVTIDFLNDEHYNEVRRTHIVNTIQKHIAYYINEHNVYTKSLDMTYTFTMPLIPKEDWYNTVDDISILAFFQGYPQKYDVVEYQNFAFAGSRLQFRERILAGELNGKKIFWPDSCSAPTNAIEIYNSKKEAAKQGYFEYPCINSIP